MTTLHTSYLAAVHSLVTSEEDRALLAFGWGSHAMSTLDSNDAMMGRADTASITIENGYEWVVYEISIGDAHFGYIAVAFKGGEPAAVYTVDV